ncbi:PilZ domain-containing protein [Alkalihalobacillus deserti]|uniref:PilZ domain-containing protein n=1 Tax=Alkalihalobacillus deserti TaxID=2879466 RepID=UPI001D15860E|nr:PilZ domain-containing protein [Alkalihalobacillus deserti]
MKNRLYPRILFQQPLEGYLVIHTINEQAIDSNKRKVKIHNIGLGGLSFSTDLDFPMKDGISLTLKVDILSLGTVSGELAWKQKKYNDTYYYGLKAIVCNLNYLKGCLNATIVGETPYKPFNNRVL